MKMRDIIQAEKCKTKNFYSGFSEKKEKNYYNGVILTELFKTYGLNFNSSDIMGIVTKTIPQETFHTSREQTINATLLVLRLLRFQEYYTKNVLTSTAIIHKAGKTFATNSNIEVDYHFIVEDGDQVTIVKVHNAKCGLSNRGKSVFTNTSDNMELFLLQEAAKKVIPGKVSYTSQLIYLRHPDDKGENLVPTSEFTKKGKTIMTASFVGATKQNEMIDRLNDIMAGTSKHQCLDCSTGCPFFRLCTYEPDNTNLLVIPQKAKVSGNAKFTQDQQFVMNAENGIWRVLAVAGAGKTTCIANRISNLIKNGTSIHDILLITYTVKGADEMREKIAYWLKKKKINVDVKHLNIFTFHSFGFELVKKEYKRFGYSAEPTPIEKSEKIALIKSLLDSRPEIEGFNYKDPVLDMPYAKGVVLTMDNYFNIIKTNDCVYPEEVQKLCGIKKKDVATEILLLYKDFKEHMLQNNLVDYIDLINLCYEILKDTNCLKQYGFEHIMVDEFQDSDNYQISILKLLSTYAYFKSLMVVGDDSQAIFSWRGATAYNILHFTDIFPSAFDINLLENFRSTQEICSLANIINDINREKIPKSLKSSKTGRKPLIFHLADIQSYVEKMLEVITYYGYNFSDVALIARNKKDLLEMKRILVSKNVPCVMSVNELLIDNPVVQHLIDFAKYIQDLSSDLYFLEWLQVSNYDEFVKQTKTTLPGYVQTRKDAFENELLNCNNELERIKLVMDMFESISSKNRGVKSLIDILKSKSFATLNEMCQFMIDMETYKADYTIEKLEEPVNAITLTTAHSSKGREWTFVGIYLSSFSYPSETDYPQVKNNPGFEEERRLLFVAITRAKEFLVLGGDCHSTCYQEVAHALQQF